MVTDANPTAPVMAEADRAFLVRPIKDPDYFNSLLALCVENRIDLLVSLNDLELSELARQAERFLQAGTRVVISAPEVIDICADKVATARFLAEFGILVPRTFTSLESVHEALASKEIGFPLVVKARWGSGSIGLEFVDDEEELEIAHSFVEKKVRRSFLADLADDPQAACVVIQPCIAGKEFHLDVVNDLQGRFQATLCKEKLAMRAGETDKAMTVHSDKLNELGARLSRALGHVGNLDADVLSGPDGDYVIDLNPRFGGGYPFAHVAGANVPAALLAWAEGETARPEWLRVKSGVVSSKCDRLVAINKSIAMKSPGLPITTITCFNSSIIPVGQ